VFWFMFICCVRFVIQLVVVGPAIHSPMTPARSDVESDSWYVEEVGVGQCVQNTYTGRGARVRRSVGVWVSVCVCVCSPRPTPRAILGPRVLALCTTQVSVCHCVLCLRAGVVSPSPCSRCCF
jgi:hypothetical protein